MQQKKNFNTNNRAHNINVIQIGLTTFKADSWSAQRPLNFVRTENWSTISYPTLGNILLNRKIAFIQYIIVAGLKTSHNHKHYPLGA